ncbi:MAG: hypothetical protein ACI91G_001170 [Gammaproteobacteria bacterium]|jgi:hypothetical protein
MAGDINFNNMLNRDRRMLLGSMAALAFTPIVGGCGSPQQSKSQKTVDIPLAEPSEVELPALGGDPASVFPASVASGDPKRLSAAVEMAIRKEIDKGHTYTTQNAIRPTVRKLLGSTELATQAFMAGHQKAQFVLNWEAGTYHPTAQLLMESVVAKRLLKLAAQRDAMNLAHMRPT